MGGHDTSPHLHFNFRFFARILVASLQDGAGCGNRLSHRITSTHGLQFLLYADVITEFGWKGKPAEWDGASIHVFLVLNMV